MWKEQILKLRASLEQFTKTDPLNMLQHFFSQAMDLEYMHELDDWKKRTKTLVIHACSQSVQAAGCYRQRAAAVIRSKINVQPILCYLRLSDIRNRVVFEIYKQHGVAVDTYFERHMAQGASPDQQDTWSTIAHGMARITSADTIQYLSNILQWMHLLKRVFMLYDVVTSNVKIDPEAFMSVSSWWIYSIQNNSMGDLIWNLFLDLWSVEHA